MTRYLFLVCLSLAVGALGCEERKKPPPPAAPVKGTVTLDGKPMPEGEIILSLGETPSVLVIKDGAFAGTALTGSNHVEIRAFKVGPPLSTDPNKEPTKVNFIPSRYNVSSTLTADVTTGGTNEFKFDVTSR
jgi:hypothetical protein